MPEEQEWLQHDVAQSEVLSVESPLMTHVPHVLAVTSQTLLPSQPELAVHVVAQAVLLRHAKLPVQTAALVEHWPVPVQVPAGVSMPALQVFPQAVLLVGYTQAPEVSQSVAPQAPPVVQLAVVEQQWVPVPPLGPQSALVHWSLPPHAAPVPPLATQVPPAPGVAQ